MARKVVLAGACRTAIGTMGAIAGRVIGIATMRPRIRMLIAARVYLKTLTIACYFPCRLAKIHRYGRG